MQALSEVVVPYPEPLEPTKQVRSTLLCASIQSLRQRGLYEKYLEELDPHDRMQAQALTPGLWLPVERAVVHYLACDRLPLTKAQRIEIGGDVAQRIQQSLVSVIVRLTRESGVTPWTVVTNAEKLRQRSWQGGGIRVSKAGPKDAVLEWTAQPCVQSVHFRLGFGGLLKALGELYARRAFVNEEPSKDPATLVMKISWA